MTSLELTFVLAMFTIGFMAHVLKVANDDVQKTLFKNIRAWFQVFYINVLVRLGLGLALWGLYATNPTFFVSILGHFGINVNNSVPVTKIVSVLVGYAADSLMDLGTAKIPWLGRLIPPAYIPPDVQAQNKESK